MTKVVILAGGLGTRLREETEFKPKPMVEIGGLPILWHIIDNFRTAGFNEFIIATGYKGNVIKEFFFNLNAYISDFSVEYGAKNKIEFHSNSSELNHFKVSVVDTGLNTFTGGRIKKLQEYIGGDDFICTYGDGLSNVNPKDLLEFHRKQKRIATVTAIKPRSRFGQLHISESGIVNEFQEKPIMDEWVNGGFFVFSKPIFDYLGDNDVLEESPLAKLVADGQLAAHKHTGFWFAMDTYREFLELNSLWDGGETPWKINY